MENTDKKNKYSRRNFLETGLAGAAGVALGLAAGELLKMGREAPPEMVKMLTADGKLVLVDKRFVPPVCGKPVAVSNQELREWMKNGEKPTDQQ